MAIKIIKEPDIYLTEAEYERLHWEYLSSMQRSASAMSFEEWVRQIKAQRGETE